MRARCGRARRKPLRGKRRLHKTPSQREILACNRWLQSELRALNPVLILAMGGTAARALFGKAMAIQVNRGRQHSLVIAGSNASRPVMVTVHPSYLLRAKPPDRERLYQEFVRDLRRVKSALQKMG